MKEQDLKKLKKEELLKIAKKLGLKNLSKLNKSELIKVLLQTEGTKETKEEVKKEKKVKEEVKIDFNKMNKTELVKLAKKKGVKVTTKMKKDELIKALKKASEKVLKEKSEKEEKSISDEEIKTKTKKFEMLESPEEYEKLAALEHKEHEEYQLPTQYGENKIVLLTRDPHWLHAYWEITESKKQEIYKLVGENGLKQGRLILRIYDVTDIHFDSTNAHKYFDIDLSEDSKSWYIYIEETNRTYCVDLGFLTQNGKLILIARSNVINIPRDEISELTPDEEEYMTIQEEIYKMSGAGKTGESSISMKSKLEMNLGSGAVSSFAGKKEERNFWSQVHTELILYGATEPDAKVTIQGNEVKLRPDGTFTLRFALPDGKQIIPVHAISSDEKEERWITPVVTKDTK